MSGFSSPANRKAFFAKNKSCQFKKLKPLKELKGITNKQYQKAIKEDPSLEKRFPKFGNEDGDSRVNLFDCRPFDKKKQDEYEDEYQERIDDEARDARPGSGVSHEQAESDFFNVFKKRSR